MAQQWKEFKRSWKSSLNLYQALAALKDICSESLKHNEASWKQCGFEINKKLNRDRLLVDRSAELFSSERNATKRQPGVSTRVLELVHKVAPKRRRCEECNSWILASHKFCCHCKSPNKNFDPEAFQIHRDGRRGQWQKNAEAEEPDCLDDATVTAVTDILKELRSRTNKKSKTDGTCPEPSTEAAPSSTDVAPAAPDPEDEMEPGEPESPEEWDMSKPSVHNWQKICSLYTRKCAFDRSVYIGRRCVARSCRVRGRGAAFTVGSMIPQDMLQGLSRLGVVFVKDLLIQNP